MRCCTRCGETKHTTLFYARRDRSGEAPRISSQCKECIKARARRRSAEAQRAASLWTNYRLRPEQVEAMLAAQGGRCAICKSPDPGRRTWCIDHDHTCCSSRAKSCGACVRGLLCGRCNVLLGMARDDGGVLAAAIDYLGERG